MKRFVEGADRGQSMLFPECLDDWIDEDNPVRVIDIFVDELDLGELGFSGVDPKATGRPSYHPSALLKLYVYGYLNRVQSSRRLEREAGRNVEVMWLTGRLVPDHKTIELPAKRWTPLLSSFWSRKVFYGYGTSSIYG
jgi:transposase